MQTHTPVTKPVIDQLDRLGCTGVRAQIGVRPSDGCGRVCLWCPETDPDGDECVDVSASDLADLLGYLPAHADIPEGEGEYSVWELILGLDADGYRQTKQWLTRDLGLTKPDTDMRVQALKHLL